MVTGSVDGEENAINDVSIILTNISFNTELTIQMVRKKPLRNLSGF